VVGAAVVRAGVVLAAAFDALVAPFLANVEGDGLRVLGYVGGLAVCADAAVGEGIRVTCVGFCGGGVSGVLQADQRALGLLVVTPELPEGQRDGVGVDGVLLLGEGGADEGEDAECQYGTHGDINVVEEY